MLIKEILTIDLSEDIKNVIDLEDMSEAETKAEIENYIVTEGLAKEYADFVTKFTSNILETGVWISGFYGSGKSYFGKLLGYMLSNRNIAGTPARDRILQRFSGLRDEALIKNSIARLGAENCRVVFLDVAKQDTSKGLAYTLFRNFLKSLELPENEHGFLLFQLLINDNTININEFITKNSDKKWPDIRPRMVEYAKLIKVIYMQKGNSEGDYTSLLETIRRDIDQFSATRLKEELQNYLKISKDEKVVFLFDEASEAISQKKFNLLDLEGISESLSALGGKVWTMAIAQEKLDDIINNSNVSKAQLTKVTDRFKTKIHLEATEVDVIIRSRLLNKTEAAVQSLKDHYQKNSGKISDHSSLTATGLAKTDTPELYATYYPFYKYQFDLLQNFLFGTKGYASTKVAARGMIITTYDILKHELQNNSLFEMATGWQISKEAQLQPPAYLVNRFTNAETILKESQSSISGRHLLETINFLVGAEVVPATLTNIVKAFIKDPEAYHKVEADIAAALNNLVEAKVLLFSNNSYRITSDIEQRLLDEMNGFTVQGYVKKKQLVTAYKASLYIKAISRISDANSQYDFYITTDNEDELTSPTQKQLKLRLKGVYNISDDRIADIEGLRVQHQNDKDLIYLVPDNVSFKEIDRLIDDIERTSYLEQKYSNSKSEEGQILRSFSTAKTEKEARLKNLIEESLQNSTAIYLYNLFQLDKDNWQTTLQGQQRQVVQNIYFKRLDSQLSDTIATSVIKEATATRLKQFFHGNDFHFFDDQGNFVGDNLKVTEEVLFKIRNTFVDGATLEKELEMPPTGFAFGTVISTVAALMRAGKVMAKHNASEKFSWRDDGVKEIFGAAREFRKASFKAIGKALTTQQKNDIVTALQGLNCEDHIGKKVDWNTNDFDLVSAIRELAKRFCDKVEDMRRQNKDFDQLFTDAEANKDALRSFTGAVSEANYIEKAENFLKSKESYANALQAIEKIEKFIRTNLPKVRQWRTFVSGVNDELIKSAQPSVVITDLEAAFNKQYLSGVVNNYAGLQQCAQNIKDEYFKLIQCAVVDMAAKYTVLTTEAEAIIQEIAKLPVGLNDLALDKAKNISLYAQQRTQTKVDIDFDIKDKHSRFTYSEILSFIDLYNSKKTELEILKSGLIRTTPPKPEPGNQAIPSIKTFTTKMPSTRLKVSAYKSWLGQEMQKISSANDNDEIELIE
ncbi:MAG: BREX system P-loop protein BrxC [Candidatus Margulisiibacteriota bacterium]|nr:MAG: BREX system P-loop protein BrxC [Candidatus Margulisiibacteriota bacterium]